MFRGLGVWLSLIRHCWATAGWPAPLHPPRYTVFLGGARYSACTLGPLAAGLGAGRPYELARSARDYALMKDSSDGMAGDTARHARVLAGHAQFLITTAARAPSVHNTQPWRFRVGPDTVELWCDPRRKLRVDPSGREMLISCGAALFGLRLAVRSLGYLPIVELLPDPGRLRLMARVSIGIAAPISGRERHLLQAVPHRHTHRGPFAPSPLSAGLLARLQHDVLAEGATAWSAAAARL